MESSTINFKVLVDNKNVNLILNGLNDEVYNLRIGAGGAIVSILNNLNEELVSPPYKEERTDRIIQWTIWSDSIKGNILGFEDYANRFNITQGGTEDGVFNPIQRVEVFDDGIDVYSTASDNWRSELQQVIQGGFSILTRYRFLARGFIKIIRILKINKIYFEKEEKQLKTAYIESWTPVNRMKFNAFAMSFDAELQPLWWYKDNVPFYPNIPMNHTNGYVVSFNTNNLSQEDILTFNFSREDPEIFDKDGIIKSDYSKSIFNCMQWDTGIGILPAFKVDNLEEGDVIISEYVLGLHKGFNSKILSQINELKLNSPKLWKKNANLNPVLDSLVLGSSNLVLDSFILDSLVLGTSSLVLDSLLSLPFDRTGNLASLVVYENSKNTINLKIREADVTDFKSEPVKETSSIFYLLWLKFSNYFVNKCC